MFENEESFLNNLHGETVNATESKAEDSIPDVNMEISISLPSQGMDKYSFHQIMHIY